MSADHFRYLQDNADDIIPVLYDHAQKLAARKFGWTIGKTLPLGKTPEDIVTDVYTSYAIGAASPDRKVKGARHFDPTKDIMLQLKGSIRSAMWALRERASAKNEALAAPDADPIEEDLAPTDPLPDDLVASKDFAEVAAQSLTTHPTVQQKRELRDLLALFDLGIIELADQARELGMTPQATGQLRFELRQIYVGIIHALNKE
jgi:hypothetical protein